MAWVITNGWAYAFIPLGSYLNLKWMTVVGTTWVAFLWLPFTIEKPITIAIAIFIEKKLFIGVEHDNIKKESTHRSS